MSKRAFDNLVAETLGQLHGAVVEVDNAAKGVWEALRMLEADECDDELLLDMLTSTKASSENACELIREIRGLHRGYAAAILAEEITEPPP